MWGKVVGAMPPGVFTACDAFLLASYCEAVAMHRIATRALDKGPHEVAGSTGQTKLSPWFAQQSEAARLIAQLGSKLGLDPISRQHINAGTTGQVDDEFGDLIH